MASKLGDFITLWSSIMNPRLLILIVVAAGLAIFFAAVKGRSKPDTVILDSEMTPEQTEQQRDTQLTLDQRDLPGTEPPEDPDLVIQVEVDRSRGKNRLYFNISEAHGFYVEQFRVRFWSVRAGKEDPEDSPLVLSHFFDRYLPAKETLRLCLEVVPAELSKIGGDIGETSQWRAEVESHGRWRAKNPDPLPPRTDIVDICD